MHEGLANTLDELQRLTQGEALSAMKELIERFDHAISTGLTGRQRAPQQRSQG